MEQQVQLDDYRDAIASLHLGDALVGHLATRVESMRAPLLFRRQERVWLLVTLLDGTVDVQEDYAPWSSVRELHEGHIEWSWGGGAEQTYVVRWLTGEEEQEAWLRYGLLEDVGAYMRRARRQRVQSGSV